MSAWRTGCPCSCCGRSYIWRWRGSRSALHLRSTGVDASCCAGTVCTDRNRGSCMVWYEMVCSLLKAEGERFIRAARMSLYLVTLMLWWVMLPQVYKTQGQTSCLICWYLMTHPDISDHLGQVCLLFPASKQNIRRERLVLGSAYLEENQRKPGKPVINCCLPPCLIMIKSLLFLSPLLFYSFQLFLCLFSCFFVSVWYLARMSFTWSTLNVLLEEIACTVQGGSRWGQSFGDKENPIDKIHNWCPTLLAHFLWVKDVTYICPQHLTSDIFKFQNN